MQLSLASKLFLASAVAWVTGRSTHLKIKGTQEEVDVISAALHATKDVLDALSDPDITVESVIDKLNVKNSCGKDFERVTGQAWPL
jgi:3-hydroxyacyl-CoA dehydrogenase